MYFTRCWITENGQSKCCQVPNSHVEEITLKERSRCISLWCGISPWMVALYQARWVSCFPWHSRMQVMANSLSCCSTVSMGREPSTTFVKQKNALSRSGSLKNWLAKEPTIVGSVERNHQILGMLWISSHFLGSFYFVQGTLSGHGIDHKYHGKLNMIDM